MIKFDFEFDTELGMFRDAIHLPDDHVYTAEQIQTMKEQRRDNWIAFVKMSSEAPSEEVAANEV